MVERTSRVKFIANGVKKRIYYHPDGSPTKPLPADSYSLRHYLAKGFTLEPPKRSFVCENCGKEFDFAIALGGHKRGCNKK
ncbi:hypothetical protein KJ781_04955 [Patescibacteria group bacterium]|uniref:C2H2-type domain-containing protein n=1 Tax=viral metagenome TaxID=1070528 RepID=A0A6H1ZMA7_9ZZZZ|nr:hypothetical protein [Patescibacteria group bacterium]